MKRQERFAEKGNPPRQIASFPTEGKRELLHEHSLYVTLFLDAPGPHPTTTPDPDPINFH